MRWTLSPKNKDFTTSLPLTVEIEEWKGNPEVRLSSVGKLELKTFGSKLKSEFYLTLPGTYRLDVKDSVSTQHLEFKVAEHHYLSFESEFGFFFILFLIVMGGIIAWTRKIMSKSTPEI